MKSCKWLFGMLVFLAIASIAGADVLVDGDCESQTIQNPGWAALSGTAAFTTAQASSGAASLEFVCTSGVGGGTAVNGSYAATPGNVFTLTWDARKVAGFVDGGDVLVQIGFFNADFTAQTGFKNIVTTPSAAGAWESFRAQALVPAGTAWAQVICYIGLSSSSDGTLYLDNFVMDEGLAPVDGDCESQTAGVQPGWVQVIPVGTGTAALTTEDASGGVASLKFACDTLGNYGYAANVGYTNVATDSGYLVSPGQQIQLNYDIKTSGFTNGGDAIARILFYDAAYGVLSNADWLIPASEGMWTRTGEYTTAPAGAAYYEVWVWFGYASLSSGTAYMDNFEVIVSDSLPINGNCESPVLKAPGWWNLTGISYTSEDVSEGSFALKCDLDAGYCFLENAGFTGALDYDQSLYVAQPGYRYTLAFDCNTPAGSVIGGDNVLRISWRDSANVELSYVDVPVTATNGWETLSGTFAAPAGAEFYVVNGHLNYGAGSSGVIYLDNFVVTETPPPVLGEDTVNILADGDCESGLFVYPGWGAVSADVIYDPNDDASDGSGCLAFGVPANPANISYATNDGWYPVGAGDTFQLEFMYKSSVGASFAGSGPRMDFQFINSAYDAVLSTEIVPLSLTEGQWVAGSSGVIEAPAGSAWVRATFFGCDTANYMSSGEMRVDDVKLLQSFATLPAEAYTYWYPTGSYYSGFAPASDPNNWNMADATNGSNWSAGRPSPGDFVIIPFDPDDEITHWPVIDEPVLDVLATCVGWDAANSAEGYLFVTDGGSLEMNERNSSGALGISFMRVGNLVPGYVYMDGGEIITPVLQLGYSGTGFGQGEFYLDGGVLRIRPNATYTDIAFGQEVGDAPGGFIDITGDGMIIWENFDARSRLNGHIANGYITGDGGAWPLEVTYDGTDTIVKLAACAVFPDGDLNSDCKVDLVDFALLASEWLINDGATTPVKVWEADMSIDPIDDPDGFKTRTATSNNYTVGGGILTIASGALYSQNVIVDTIPKCYADAPTTISATMRTTDETQPGDYNNAALNCWLITDYGQALSGITRFCVEKVSATEQHVLFVEAVDGTADNDIEHFRLTGFGTGMIDVTCTWTPDGTGTGGSVVLDATDGVTTYTGVTANYSNNLAVTDQNANFASLGYAGEVDYFYVSTDSLLVAEYDLTDDKVVDMDDFVILAANWLADTTP